MSYHSGDGFEVSENVDVNKRKFLVDISSSSESSTSCSLVDSQSSEILAGIEQEVIADVERRILTHPRWSFLAGRECLSPIETMEEIDFGSNEDISSEWNLPSLSIPASFSSQFLSPPCTMQQTMMCHCDVDYNDSLVLVNSPEILDLTLHSPPRYKMVLVDGEKRLKHFVRY